MEDVAANFSKPCVADIKIGRQTWDPYSTPEKQLSEDVLNIFFYIYISNEKRIIFITINVFILE